MALTFRKAVPSEHDDARRVLWTAFTPYVRNLGREITAHDYTFLAAAIARGDVYLALDGEEIVGVAATERRDSGIYIDRLGVAPTRRAPGSGASCWSESRRSRARAASRNCRWRRPRWRRATSASIAAMASRSCAAARPRTAWTPIPASSW